MRSRLAALSSRWSYRLEFVPFAATAPALAITLFGLSLIARDGALIVLAFSFSAGSFSLAAGSLL